MRKFDTKVQLLKYKVLREVARHAWKGDLAESIPDIPKEESCRKARFQRFIRRV